MPDLALDLGYGRNGAGDPSFTQQGLEQDSYHAGLSLSIPLQQLQERNSYRSAQLRARGRRLALGRRIQGRQPGRLRARDLPRAGAARAKQSLEIQTELIADRNRNVKIRAQLRFEQGSLSNRDVVEAQQALLDAQNSLIREKVAYEIARLGLLKDLGLLFIDEKGMWKE
ncbi:MAG: TolC family protein [Planctomycetes bacterium]|nr:TolC family protein [Planctomycetota bacterium]